MLGSPNEGERANAGAIIDAMAKRYKIMVVDLLAMALAPAQPPPRAAPPPPQPPPRQPPRQSGPVRWSNVRPPTARTELLDTLQTIADNEDAFEFVLTEWECNFAADVAQRYSSDDELSPKQLNVVERIVDKVRRANGRT
jgi:hypothetical protein